MNDKKIIIDLLIILIAVMIVGVIILNPSCQKQKLW